MPTIPKPEPVATADCVCGRPIRAMAYRTAHGDTGATWEHVEPTFSRDCGNPCPSA